MGTPITLDSVKGDVDNITSACLPINSAIKTQQAIMTQLHDMVQDHTAMFTMIRERITFLEAQVDSLNRKG